MKSVAVNAVLAATAVQGYLLPPKSHKIDWKLEQKRQIVGSITSLLGKGGRVADPPGAAPRRVTMNTTSPIAGVKRVKMRYGPYSVPNVNKTSLVGEPGMLWNYPDLKIPKPCESCTIVGQYAGLEYPDGKNANIDTGLWLHHMVQLAIGPGRWDPTCYGRPSLPHIDVNASPQNSERYFSSGNERTHIEIDILGKTKTRFGYHIKNTDKFGFIVDLMNMNTKDATVYLTMTYDLLEGPLPQGWKDIKVVWFDAAQCGTSEVTPPKQNGAFTVSSGKWRPNFDGELLGVGGHIHDGGTNIKIFYNQGQQLCDSKAGYAEKPEYITGAMGGMGGMASHGGHRKRQAKGAKQGGGGHGHSIASKHISSMTTCYLSPEGKAIAGGARTGLPIPKLAKDQSWYVSAFYDYDKFEGNKASGKQDGIMAIALMYVAVEPGVAPPGGAAAAPKGKGAAAAPKGKGKQGGRMVEIEQLELIEPVSSLDTIEPIIEML